MKNKMYTLGRVSIRALLMLGVTLGISGCKDDYTLDDEMPSWLGESIYERLQNDGGFTNYLSLMDDLDMKEILSRTGSRTLFAANDSAFTEFYKKNATLPESNPWHTATSYENLSASQKSLLAKATMLNNAITMEQLSTAEYDASAGERPRGQVLRRNTLMSIADSITWLEGSELPYSHNKQDEDAWEQFRDKGMYLTDGDGTNNMMLCFTPEQRAKRGVLQSDFERVVGRQISNVDVYLDDSRILEQDITCQNGYINKMESVVCPLSNMAEVIRTNGDTKIFNHILDRFAYPVYVDEYNRLYQQAHPEFLDPIYTKWYLSKTGMSYLCGTSGIITVTTNSNSNKVYLIPIDKSGNEYRLTVGDYALRYDPSWNACNYVDGGKYNEDMGAMFVPCDSTLLLAFQTGQLSTLIEEYASEYAPAAMAVSLNDGDLEPLYKAIDQIPMNTIYSLIANLMQISYNNSVESKFTSLKDDAQEALFSTGSCDIKTVKLACNGAVYITNSIHTPADYSSVAAPAFIRTTNQVIKYAIYSGQNTAATDYLRGLNYYAYLKAMTSRFTFFLPNDEGMKFVYNPMSFSAMQPRLLALSINESYKKTGVGNPINCATYPYYPATGTFLDKELMGASITMDDIGGVLSDILQTHTLVHDSEADLISQNKNKPVSERDQYFVTKNNDAIKVTYSPTGEVAYVQGGFQIENEQAGIVGTSDMKGVTRCNVNDKSKEYQTGGNGDTYVIDAPMIPAVKSVHKVLSEHEQFSEFLKLCSGINTDIIDSCGMYEGLSASLKRKLQNTHQVFVEKTSTLDQITSFFNQYQYTVFVPKNDALRNAIDNGIVPDWEDIEADFIAHNDVDDEGYRTGLRTAQDSARIKAKILYLFNFIRLHFMDTSVFADKSAWEDSNQNNFATSCYYVESDFSGYDPNATSSLGNFMKLHVKRLGGNKMTVQGLLNDGETLCGQEANVVTTEVDNNVPLFNVMAREFTVIDESNNETSIQQVEQSKMNNKRVSNVSAAVIHLIDNVLTYRNEPLNFNDPAKVAKYLRCNKVVNKADL